ncbi:MAG: DUF1549 and DUF1553 domain-containing protein [Candidatus Sumerlaeota bacterium]|nr:DUF1549 and DUF1553 domain-containing protein [Candidatus Sumerlaeota bacterium]
MKPKNAPFFMLALAILGLVLTQDRAARKAGADEKATGNPAPVSYIGDVAPLITYLGCNAIQCHGSMKGKGGLRLSMFAGDPEYDYESLTKAAQGRCINRFEPKKSLFLLKATNDIRHGGGRNIRTRSAEYETLLSWVAQGAPYDDERQPKLVAVKAAPEDQKMYPSGAQQLALTAEFSDGSHKDVTRLAAFKSSDAKVASVSAGGAIKAAGYGETYVIATYMRQSAVARITVPQYLLTPFPDVAPNNKIDELVFAKLKNLGIPPSEVCTDQEFLRRVYLDTIGVLPTAQEARAFLSDSSPQKRRTLIDRLLERDEFIDFQALKWGDLLRIKSEFPVKLWPKAVQTYYRWVRDSLARNQPYDQFVRELLTSNGSNFRSGPANFFRAVPSKDSQTIGETAALVFMGARIGCARCHGHPYENWSTNDDLALAAFFSKVSFKATTEWKEEIVFTNPKGALRHPMTKEIIKPKFPDGETVEIAKEEDPREKFAEWLTSPRNPWFAKNIVNRIWFWLLGRGIIHEPDDLRATNPPENPELLEYLEKELINHKYDLKHIFRLVLNSKVYQLSSKPGVWNEKDAKHFSHYQTKRLGAEQLLDAISQLTETSEPFSSQIPEPYSRLPPGYKAAQLADGSIGTPFLELFGRPTRDTPYESERNLDTSIWQTLYFINSDQIEGKLMNSPRLRRMAQAADKNDPGFVEEIYLSALSRPPTKDEKQKMVDFIGRDKTARAQAIRDMVWAILNTKEFMFIH